MAFQLQVSNSLNQLAAQISLDIHSSEKNVFQPVYIVTQTEGMNNWLKLQIADSTGIAANIRFLKPNDLINTIYYLLGGSFSKSLSTEDLNWLLYKLLGDEDFIKKHPSISTYYNYEGIDKDVKRMALAEKVADLFDQYQIYRADMIEKWNDTSHEIAKEEWQKELWLKAKVLAGEDFPDKTLIGNFIQNELKDPVQTARLRGKLPVIYLFGISVITEYHLQIFQNLSNHIDIQFLILNPAPYDYWFEDKSEKLLYFLKKIGKIDNGEINIGNPLLTGWGKIIQETFSLLFKNDELINAYNELETIEPEPDTLLHKIQHSIFNNRKEERETYFKENEILDGSLTINSCYSPAREVEVLYNYLVHLIDRKKEILSARDMVVMVSDIDLYASYIKAVFDNAPYKFHYTIADESYAASDSISNALLSVLSITEQNFTAENVVRLLDFSSIRKRLKITDTAFIRKLVDAANIRFGITGNRDDDSDYVSWKYGLQRIMYGICMSGSDENGTGEKSFFPLDIIEGSDTYDAIRFAYFVEALIDSLNQRKKSKSISDWSKYVENALNNFVCDKEETTDEDYGLLLNQLENYNTINELFTDEISYEVFIHGFLPTLSGATRSRSFAGAGITFCSLIPMRSIPFKVVALLGLDFDKFPRKDKKISFNLMEKEKRKGDRNIKENDKHLFLETLLSAKDYLYISYIGQSVKDNSIFPPSILIDELIDYIESVSVQPDTVRKQLITRQPLHGFSEKYLKNDEHFYSYLLNAKEGIKNINKQRAIDLPDFKEIPLHKLIGFLKNPFKGYYNSVLGIYYNEDEITLPDTEVFTLDNLEEWQLKNQLLKNNEEEKKDFKIRKLKTGELPLKNMANVVLDAIENEILPVKELFLELTNNEEEQEMPIELTFGEHTLKGSVGNVYGKNLISVSFSKRENKYLLEGYINYLAARAAGYKIELYFISQKENKQYAGKRITKENAYTTLKNLLDLYIKGHENILAFNPDFGIDPNKLKELDDAKFSKTIGKFNKDSYLSKEYENGFFQKENVMEDYRDLAETLLVPLADIFPDYLFKPKK